MANDTTTTTADPDRPLEKRVDGIEAEQKRQGGMLEQILAKVGGGQAPAAPGGTDPAAGGPVSAAAMQGEIAQRVREEIQLADQRRAAEQEETKWKDGVNQTLEKIKRERAPREPETGVRAAVQRLVIGRQK